jgi:two-component system, response regulator PdtaR
MGEGNRWRVAIVDDHERSRASLRAAIWSAGGSVVGEVTRRLDALERIRRWSPDVAILAVGLPDGDGLDAAAEISTSAPCAMVLCTSHAEAPVIRRAIEVGVMGYLLKPLRPGELAPTLDIAVARFREVHDLRRALEERKIVERAKGVLMARYQLSEEDAFKRLRRAAMDSRRPMAEVARAVLVSDSVAATSVSE